MITVYKQTLAILDEQKVPMHKGARILQCGEQDGHIRIWYVCDPEAELTEETFYVVATGQQLPDTFPGLYTDTVQVGEYVWHVFFKRKAKKRDPIVAERKPAEGGDNGA